MRLYRTQEDLKAKVYAAWKLKPNVLAVSATGSGKTVVFSSILNDQREPCVVIAHRKEILTQISTKLAMFGVKHQVIGPQATINECIAGNVADTGGSFVSSKSKVYVAGVDTLLARKESLWAWGESIRLWVQDEAHHVLKSNKWGKVLELFPRAQGLGVTANTVRSDGKGLGIDNHGVFDTLVLGEPMRGLIERGQLSTYKIVAAPTDFDAHRCKISASTGDYTQKGLKAESKRSQITGDIVTNYKKFAPGRRCIVFVTDVETAGEVSGNFNAVGVRAEAISAKTPNFVRSEFIRKFKAGLLDVIVNVDLFGEGFDVPSVECVILARPTESFNLYCQQFGRALRPPLPGIIIDHVGNWVRHGLPEAFEAWSLEPRETRSKSKTPPPSLKSCLGCMLVYDRYLTACPHCGFIPEPAPRAKPEQVDGDLAVMDLDYITSARAVTQKYGAGIDTARTRLSDAGLTGVALAGAVNHHVKRKTTHGELREEIAIWGAQMRQQGYSDREAYRIFFMRFGMDVLTAQTLKQAEAANLKEKIQNDGSGSNERRS